MSHRNLGAGHRSRKQERDLKQGRPREKVHGTHGHLRRRQGDQWERGLRQGTGRRPVSPTCRGRTRTFTLNSGESLTLLSGEGRVTGSHLHLKEIINLPGVGRMNWKMARV